MTKTEAKKTAKNLSSTSKEVLKMDGAGYCWAIRGADGLVLDHGFAPDVPAAEWAGTLALRSIKDQVMRTLAR